MIIHKILNNNVVVTLNENDKEQVIMGKGIAFKKKSRGFSFRKSSGSVFLFDESDYCYNVSRIIG